MQEITNDNELLNKKIRVLAVDDEVLQLNKLIKSINGALPNAEVIAFSSIPEIESWIERDGKPDVAFLDIELGSISGMIIAKMLQKKNPQLNIIFVTGYLEYAPQAINMRASGYVSKPVTEEKIKIEMENLRFPMPKPNTNKKITVRCFGKFEVLKDGVPLKFKREKAKELFAYLIDKNGTVCSPREISAVLWEEDKFDYLRKLTQELRETLSEVGASDVFVCGFKRYRIEPNLIECDYYDYLLDRPYAIKEFRGIYMEQYSWAEETLATLLR